MPPRRDRQAEAAAIAAWKAECQERFDEYFAKAISDWDAGTILGPMELIKELLARYTPPEEHASASGYPRHEGAWDGYTAGLGSIITEGEVTIDELRRNGQTVGLTLWYASKAGLVKLCSRAEIDAFRQEQKKDKA